MIAVHTDALVAAKRVRLVDADHLLMRLTGLARSHEERGRISHCLGVRSAIAQIQRDLAKKPSGGKKPERT